MHLANSQDRLNKEQDALATLERLRKLPAPERDDPRIDLAEASYASYMSNSQRAQDAYQRAIKKGTDSGARLIVAAAHYSEGFLWMQSKPDEARTAWQQAANIYAGVGDLDSRASSLNGIAMLLDQAGDAAGAEKIYREARDMHAKMGNESALWFDLNMIAHADLEQGELKDAMESYQEDLAVSRKLQNEGMEFSSLQGIGNTLQRQGDPRGARQFYQKSLDICLASKDPTLRGWCPRDLAYPFAAQGDLPRAEGLLQRSLELSEKSEDKVDHAYALESFADLLVTKAKLSEARTKYEQALAIHTEVGSAGCVPCVRLRLAALSLEEVRPAEAEKDAREAMEAFRKQKSASQEGNAHTLLARALLMAGSIEEATTEIDQASALQKKSRSFGEHFDIGIVSARILAQNHDPAEAEKQLNLLLDESTRDGLVSYQFEIRLALGEIEMKSGKTASGVPRLKSLERDATAKGFLLIAHKAKAAASGSVVG